MSSHFYKPYLSDGSDDGSSSETDNDGYTSEESLINLPGTHEPVETGQPEPYPFTAPEPNLPSLKTEHEVKPSNGGTSFTTSPGDNGNLSKNTTLFVINSRDRDTNIYPQPTYFTIRVPRVFKNIKTINISQINLLNSFFNFATVKGNTYLYVLEEGRTIYNSNTGMTQPNAVEVKIPDGTYSATDLVAALTSALNSTPIFATITLGSFITLFQNTGDYTIMFNTPGTYVYNSLTGNYDTNQTLNDIVARYFQTVQTLGQLFFSYNECLVAFYYPIMKEMIIESPTNVPFNVEGQAVPDGFTSWYDYIVFGFQGLGDPILTPIAQDVANQVIFDNYRIKHSFVYSLLNAYTCNYNAKQGRLIINAPSLNASIQADLTAQYNGILNALVTANGFQNTADFSNQYNNISFSNAALIEFYNFFQQQFTTYFGVAYGLYSASFYANSTNQITIYNTLNRYGWTTTLNPQASQITSNVTTPQISTLWKTITIPQATTSENIFISTLVVPQFTGGSLQFNESGESVFGYTDISFSMAPTTYIRAAFQTPCRQNISIMTLPRYIDERSPGTEESYPMGSSIGQTPLLYDKHSSNIYNRCDVSGNINWNMFNVNQSMFYSMAYMRSDVLPSGGDQSRWLYSMSPQILAGTPLQTFNPNYGKHPAQNDISLTTYRPYIYFQMNAANYPSVPDAHFNVIFTVETQSGNNFSAPITVTWYKDRAAFMADIGQSLATNSVVENPIHYFKTQTVSTDVSGCHMTVDVNNFQQTWFYVHPAVGTAITGTLNLRVFCTLKDIYGTYTVQTQADQLNMPYSYLLPLENQPSPLNSTYMNPTMSIYDPSVITLGYDMSGVSNNLLDYTIQAGNGNYYDPTNIGNTYYSTITSNFSYVFSGLDYQFVLNTNGSPQPPPTMSNWSLFFGPNSSNVVVQNEVAIPGNINPIISQLYYTSSLHNAITFQDTEYILANWMNPSAPNVNEEFLNPQIPGQAWSQIGAPGVFLPAINVPTVQSDMSTSSTYLDQSGISGISFFMPPASIVRLSSMVVKFAYTAPVYANGTAINNIPYNRNTDILDATGSINTGFLYTNQYAKVNVSDDPPRPPTITTPAYPAGKSWDDWYLNNRRNIKIGIFLTDQIASMPASSVSLSNALTTMTLQKVSQVNNYIYTQGTLLSREPDWGTWYEYVVKDTPSVLWDISNVTWPTGNPAYSSWRSTVTSADIYPTYYSGFSSYPYYFQAHTNVYNYTYLPRSYGLAPAVGNALINDPTILISTYTSDIPNSYTAVPFYYDKPTNSWLPGSFFGLSYTRTPCMPTANLTGASPFYGPPGPFAWSIGGGGTFDLYAADQPTLRPYYFNTKISFATLDSEYNPATDLSSFGYAAGMSNEYQDTYMFLYGNSTIKQDLADVSTIVNGQKRWAWGLESNANYKYFDDSHGYNLLSYIYNVPVRPTTPEYAVHVRAYDPIAKFNTGLRFIGKNYTDFGQASLVELASEVSTLGSYSPITDVSGAYYNQQLVNSNYPFDYDYIVTANNYWRLSNGGIFSYEYANSLITFSQAFSTTQIFGKKIGYAGIPFTFKNYPDALEQYVNFYSMITSEIAVFTNILSTATGQLNVYIADKYGNVLPPNAQNRTQFTAPIPFQFLFSTYTVPPYSLLVDQWGLGYNLGFPMKDTTPPRTTITSDTFIRIVEDYVYLKLNPEFNMNKLGITNKENLSETRDPASEDGKYFSKIILNSFASYCRSAVQQPVDFAPVLGQFTTISCQLLDRVGNQINNADCEYDFVLEITELTAGPNDASTLPATTADLNVVANTK